MIAAWLMIVGIGAGAAPMQKSPPVVGATTIDSLRPQAKSARDILFMPVVRDTEKLSPEATELLEQALANALASVPCAQIHRVARQAFADDSAILACPNSSECMAALERPWSLAITVLVVDAEHSALNVTLEWLSPILGIPVASSSARLPLTLTEPPKEIAGQLIDALFPERQADNTLIAALGVRTISGELGLFYRFRAEAGAQAKGAEAATHRQFLVHYDNLLKRQQEIMMRAASMRGWLNGEDTSLQCQVNQTALVQLQNDAAALSAHAGALFSDENNPYKKKWARNTYVAHPLNDAASGYFDFAHPNAKPPKPSDPILVAMQGAKIQADAPRSLGKAAMLSTVLSKRGELLACFNPAKGSTWRGEYPFELSFGILPDGQVVAARVALPKKVQQAVSKCLTQSVSRWQFAATQGGLAVFHLPLSYGSDGRREALLLEY